MSKKNPEKIWKVLGQQIIIPGRTGQSWLLITKGFQQCFHPVLSANKTEKIAEAIACVCVANNNNQSSNVEKDFNDITNMF